MWKTLPPRQDGTRCQRVMNKGKKNGNSNRGGSQKKHNGAEDIEKPVWEGEKVNKGNAMGGGTLGSLEVQ